MSLFTITASISSFLGCGLLRPARKSMSARRDKFPLHSLTRVFSGNRFNVGSIFAFPRVLVDPLYGCPLFRVGLVRCNEVKMLGIGPRWMAKWFNVTSQYEIKWLDFLNVPFSLIEFCQEAALRRDC